MTGAEPVRGPAGELLVLDASVVVELLASTHVGRTLSESLLTETSNLHAPALLDVEVLQVLRRLERERTLAVGHADHAAALLELLPIERHQLQLYGSRIWALRHNFTAYDAAYVSLSESLGATLLTRDMRLAKSAATLVTVRVV